MRGIDRWKELRRKMTRSRFEKSLNVPPYDPLNEADEMVGDVLRGDYEVQYWNKRKATIGRAATLACVVLVMVIAASVILFISQKGISTFVGTGISLKDFILGTLWYPDRPLDQGGPSFGILPFIVGSFSVSMLALLFAVPLGVMTAIFITEISPKFGGKVLRPCTELFVGIPSVVYGWIGLSVLVPLIRNHLGGFGFSILAGGIVLSFMILPTITSVACDALKAVPGSYREAAYSLGATRWQVISRVFVPAAGPGILTGVVLAMGRAFGETLAVQMVIGNVPIIPKSLLDPGITLTTGITMDMVNTVNGSLWNNALWSMALVLLILSLCFMGIVKLIGKRSQSQY